MACLMSGARNSYLENTAVGSVGHLSTKLRRLGKEDELVGVSASEDDEEDLAVSVCPCRCYAG